MPHPAVRADVQGLRGIAVLLVVLYHAGVPGLPGGFAGVDIFFVISGFLITGLLVREWSSSGRIDLARFFARRARRLLPAALVVIVATVLVTLWIYPPMEQREIVSGARAASIYVVNHWLAGRSIDYLGGTAEANPMLHMWSLAVEEQFYLVWPVVIMLGMRLGPGRGVAGVIAGLCLASLLACVAMTWHAQPWAFFLMPFRAWQFGAGALVQVALIRGVRPGERGSRWAGWAGAALVLASAVGLDTSFMYPGFWAAIPTFGAALLILGMHGTPRGAGAVLATPALRAAGDISYSWYLWHWPLLVFSRVLVNQPGPATTAAVLGLSVLAAIASTRWVEAPLRFAPPAWMRRSPAALCGALGASLAVGGLCTVIAGWVATRAMDPMQREFTAAVDDIPSLYAAGCHATFKTTDLPRCAFGLVGARTKVVLFGDSHAGQWFPALDRVARERGWELIALTKSSCPAAQVSVYSEVLRRRYDECDEWRERMFKRIELERPALVILSGASRSTDAAGWKAGVARTAQRIARTGARELWVRDTPWPGFNVPRCLARAQWQGRADPTDLCAFDRDKAMAASITATNAERAVVATTPNTRELDLTSVVCPTARCTTLRDGRPLYSDSNHIAASWAELQSARFAQALDGWPIGPPEAGTKLVGTDGASAAALGVPVPAKASTVDRPANAG